MNDTTGIEEGQQALWNGAGGEGWVAAQALLDRLFQPFEDRLAESVEAGSAQWVLDVGCGTGGLTLAAARLLGKEGGAVGIDIAASMITAANARLDLVRAAGEDLPACFIRDDAGSHAFAPAGFDRILSRFGVMFFDDNVGAFTNLRRAARDGATLHFAAWRSVAENPFMTAAERAAAPLLPNLPRRDPDAPGQFAFADADRVRRFLAQSGWTGIAIEPWDVACALPAADLDRYLTLLGPVGRALADADEATRRQVVETVRAAFDPYVVGSEVRFTAACWRVTARARDA